MEPEITESEGYLAPLNKVTPLSKYLAMILFIGSPFLGGWIGYEYAQGATAVALPIMIVDEDDHQPQNHVEDNRLPEVRKSVEASFIDYDVDEGNAKVYKIAEGDIYDDSLMFSTNRKFVAYQTKCMDGCDFPAPPTLFDFETESIQSVRLSGDEDTSYIRTATQNHVNPLYELGSAKTSYWESEATFVVTFEYQGQEYTYRSVSKDTPWELLLSGGTVANNVHITTMHPEVFPIAKVDPTLSRVIDTNPISQDEFVLDKNLREFRIGLLNQFTQEEIDYASILITEKTWDLDEVNNITVWFRSIEGVMTAVDSFVWGKGAEF
jgi:hypothetical protein